jgi:hypothetical protein
MDGATRASNADTSETDREERIAQLDRWNRDLRALDARRFGPFLAQEPLYALPPALVEILIEVLPNWLSPDEIRLEKDLASLCQRHSAVGAFHGMPIHDLSLSRPEAPVLSEGLFRQLGWDRFLDLQTAEQQVNLLCQRVDPLLERLDAYRGWLVTDPQFCEELQALLQRWGSLVAQLKHFPRYPVEVMNGPIGRRPKGARDVTQEFVRDFNGFFDRWELEGLATWDLPLPRGGNLTGLPLPSSVASPPTQVVLQVSPVLSLRADYPLHHLVEEAQRAQISEHLKGWLDVVRRQHARDLRFLRFRRMFLLHFYRDTVLGSRYRGRFAGHIEALDRAFGRFLGRLSEDSVKRVRTQMNILRNGIR